MLLLDARQANELAARERLVAEAAALAPHGRDTLDRLQALQARWQQQAKTVPLPRQQEQAAWVQFRAACDAVYAVRKQAGAEADAQRAASLAQKNSLCDELERMASDVAGDRQAQARLREIRSAWDAAGPVPRAAHEALQARYATALATIDHRLQHARAQTAAREREVIVAALMLCLDTEQAAVDRALRADAAEVANAANAADAADAAGAGIAAREAWQQLPAVPKQIAGVLQQRFEAAVQALSQFDAGYARRLAAARADRDALLLRLEVAFGVASPPRLTRERMAQQVAGLQSAFKGSADAGGSNMAMLAALYSLPAMADAEARERISRLIAAAPAS